jgi:hypothetical protein
MRIIAFQDVFGDVLRAKRKEQRDRGDDERASYVREEQAHVWFVIRQKLFAARSRSWPGRVGLGASFGYG